MPKRAIATLIAAALILGAVPILAGAIPDSVFVIHCEPTKAHEIFWLELVDLVSLADQYTVPLTMMFTAQWAEMILADAGKVEALEQWLSAGHEIACHHHGYWGTKDRGSTWDGYTNSPLDALDESDRGRFLGTMEDYMAVLNQLPGERLSGCLGTDAEDEVDWLCELRYATSGYSLEDAIAVPVEETVNGCDRRAIGHGLLVGQPRGAMEAAYLACDPDSVFGANAHVYNYAEFAAPFEIWFRFLHELDPEGEYRHTVSGLLGEA